MPLQGEGKSGPKESKLRSMWRREKRFRDDIAARIAWKAERGKPPGLDTETLAMCEGTLSGKDVPNCVDPTLWRKVCAEMNQAERELGNSPVE